jgi:hypothetical protein
VSWVVFDGGEGSFTNSWGGNNGGNRSGMISNSSWSSMIRNSGWSSMISDGSWGGYWKSKWSSSDDSALSPGLWFLSVSLVGFSVAVSGILNGLGVSSLGSLDLGSVFNGNWGDKSNWSWCFWSSWSNWESVGGNPESIVTSSVAHTNFLAFGVDVGVTSSNVSESITDSSVSCARLGMSKGSLTEFILAVVLGLGDGWSNNGWGSIRDWG